MNDKIKILMLTVIIAAISPAIGAETNKSLLDDMSLRGYFKAMPGIRINRDFSDSNFDNLIHNRLNFRWGITPDLNLHVEGRNRLFYNPLIKDFPMMADLLDQDDGWVDMSWVWFNEGAWIGHSEIDRLYLNFRHNNWQMRAGRQRINWGINLVSNPNDLFNTYSFFDFDYEERPGADALRVQYHTGFASRLEVAYSPARDRKESVGALLWSTNKRGYDIQAIAGYYRNRSAIGMGWAGNLAVLDLREKLHGFMILKKPTVPERAM
jgi:hypothetical protein